MIWPHVVGHIIIKLEEEPRLAIWALYIALTLLLLLAAIDYCYSAAIAVIRCPSVRLSVRPSVTFVDHVKTNKRIFEIFSPSGSHTILVFPYQTGWRYSDRNPPNGDVECRGIGRNRDSGLIALAIEDCWTCELRSDKNSYRRPCSVDRTVFFFFFFQYGTDSMLSNTVPRIGDAPANVCL